MKDPFKAGRALHSLQTYGAFQCGPIADGRKHYAASSDVEPRNAVSLHMLGAIAGKEWFRYNEAGRVFGTRPVKKHVQTLHNLRARS